VKRLPFFSITGPSRAGESATWRLLICSEETLRARLAAREPFGPETPPTFVDDTLDFNRWLREHVEHVDTSTLSKLDTAPRVAELVRARL
jgi:hypothetical protein